MERRIEEHNSGGTKSTKAKRPWKIAYTEKFVTLQEAVGRERFLKNQKNKMFYKKLCGLL